MKTWKPGKGEKYYFINFSLRNKRHISQSAWEGAGIDCQRHKFGNIFKTRMEAVRARGAVRLLLTKIIYKVYNKPK